MSLLRMNSAFRSPRFYGRIFAIAVACLLGASAQLQASSTDASPGSAKPVAGKTRGFVFSYFWYAMSYGADDCTDGLAIALAGSVVPATPYNAGRPTKKTGRFGPDGTDDQCTAPWAFEDPAMRTGHGRVAYGMNLDGSDGKAPAPNTCAHEKYTGVDGARGVDNQLYRIVGCINAYRPESTFQGNVIRDFIVSARQDGQVTTAIEINGMTDERNDPDVQVGIYSSANPTQYDANRQGVPYTSVTVTSNPRWRNMTHGKIVDGVLTTDPVDIRLDHYQGQGLKDHAELYIRGARIRLEIQPDGTAKGMLAGYSDVETVYHAEFGMMYSVLPRSFGYTCPAAYSALNKLADGYPDPKTGKCTAISTAYSIEAAPAFLIHPKDEKAAPKITQSEPAAQPVRTAEASTMTGWLRKLGW